MSPPFCSEEQKALKSLFNLWEKIVFTGSNPFELAKALGVTLTEDIVNYILKLVGHNVLSTFKKHGYTHANGVCTCDNYADILRICVRALFKPGHAETKQICVVILSTILKKIEKDSESGIEGFKLDAKALLQKEKFAIA